MKMKNVLMILVTLAVVFAMAGAVSGATGFASDDKTMTVNYTVQDSYTVTIPSDVTFVSNNGKFSSTGEVNATDVLINPDKKLVVNLTSGHHIGNGIYYLENKGSWIRYYINVTDTLSPQSSPVISGDDVLTVNAGAEHPNLKDTYSGFKKIGGFVTLTFETTQEFIDNATKSGDHRDTLRFMLSVVQSQQQINP